jgi:integrase
VLAEVITRYLDEGRRTGEWRAKTLDEKEDALELLLEVVGNKPVADLSKADARKAKDVLLKLPKNRRKSALTRNLSIEQLAAATGLTLISSRTLNSYLSQFQSFIGWATNQGYCTGNVFEGLRVARKSGASADDRRAFSPAQLQIMYLHLTENPDGLVQKDDHKWPCLIAMFTGARLNEVAQLTPADIYQKDGAVCFDFNDDDGKALKNTSSRRIVPIHKRLINLGIQDFITTRGNASRGRLFTSLTYSKQNGYGRNVGRWFNERLLPSLHMKEKGLVFHCLRHTMITRLIQADIPDPIVKALVGHTQVGVTHTHYAKEGYMIEQLQRAVNKFEF